MSGTLDISTAVFKVKDKEFKVSDLVEALQQLGTANRNHVKEIKELREQLAKGPFKKQEDDAGDDDSTDPPTRREEVDLEKLSRKDFMGVIVQALTKHLDEKLKPIAEGAEQTSVRLQRDDMRRQLKEIEDNPDMYPDFDEFADEVQEVLKEKGNLSLDEAFALARHRNPDKTKELTDKRIKKETEEADAKKPDFLGFTPTSGKSSPNKKMTEAQASEDAWDKTIAGTPAAALLARD